MRKTQTYFAFLGEPLQSLQLSTLPPTIAVVQPPENPGVSLLVDYRGTIEVSENFPWIGDWEGSRSANIFIEA